MRQGEGGREVVMVVVLVVGKELSNSRQACQKGDDDAAGSILLLVGLLYNAVCVCVRTDGINGFKGLVSCAKME